MWAVQVRLTSTGMLGLKRHRVCVRVWVGVCCVLCGSGNFRAFEKPTVRPQLNFLFCGSPVAGFL